MLVKKTFYIKNKRELQEWILANNKRLLFRGQSDSEWKLESTYKRDKSNINSNDHNHVFENSIQYVKDKGHHLKTNLEIMSEMQHYDLKTILIDFTSDIYAALWFATSDVKNQAKDFSIFTFEFNGNLKYDLNFKEKEEVYYCPTNNKRGLAQKSYFLLDNINFEESDKITKYIIKENLRSYIDKILFNKNISVTSIYPDLKGLYLDFKKTHLFIGLFKEMSLLL